MRASPVGAAMMVRAKKNAATSATIAAKGTRVISRSMLPPAICQGAVTDLHPWTVTLIAGRVSCEPTSGGPPLEAVRRPLSSGELTIHGVLISGQYSARSRRRCA